MLRNDFEVLANESEGHFSSFSSNGAAYVLGNTNRNKVSNTYSHIFRASDAPPSSNMLIIRKVFPPTSTKLRKLQRKQAHAKAKREMKLIADQNRSHEKSKSGGRENEHFEDEFWPEEELQFGGRGDQFGNNKKALRRHSQGFVFSFDELNNEPVEAARETSSSKSSSKNATSTSSSDSPTDTSSTSKSDSSESSSKSSLELRVFDRPTKTFTGPTNSSESLLGNKNRKRARTFQPDPIEDEPREIVEKMVKMVREELEKNELDEKVIESVLKEISDSSDSIVATRTQKELKEVAIDRSTRVERTTKISRTLQDEKVAPNLPTPTRRSSLSFGETIVKNKRISFYETPQPKQDLKQQKASHGQGQIDIHHEDLEGCPLCGSKTGKISKFDLDAWKRLQMVLINQENEMFGNEPQKYFGFELYFRWKQLQEKKI